jgi:hypothetical protein
VNRVVLEGIHASCTRATRPERPRFDPVRPVVVALILVSVLILALLILLLSSGKRERRARRGRLGVFPRGVVSEALLRNVSTRGVFNDVARRNELESPIWGCATCCDSAERGNFKGYWRMLNLILLPGRRGGRRAAGSGSRFRRTGIRYSSFAISAQ